LAFPDKAIFIPSRNILWSSAMAILMWFSKLIDFGIGG